MNKYEMLTILSASLNDELIDSTLKKYTDIITTSGGKLLTVNKWGVKKLAYPINYKKEGFYVLVEFESEANIPHKINDLMNIDESVLRSLCLRKDA
jgi:small subunit ribosomal protein S6